MKEKSIKIKAPFVIDANGAFVSCLLYGKLLLSFLFFLHIQVLVVLVVEFVLKERQFLRRNHIDAETILKLPSALQGDEALVDEGSHVRVDIQCKFLDANLVD